MARKRILIAGAGDVGRRLGRRRAANGDAVWLLRRRPIEPDLAGIRTLSADLTSGAGLDLLAAAGVFFVCAVIALIAGLALRGKKEADA